MGFLDTPISLFSIGPVRSIGTINQFPYITGYMTISENTTDSLEITKKPVQQGAPVADHAFLKPTILNIKIGFKYNIGQSLNVMYKKLQALQQPTQPPPPAALPAVIGVPSPNPPAGLPQLLPFNVTTPKRTYYNMLLTVLTCTTEKRTENVLMIDATFETLLLVSVGVTSVPRSNLKNAGSNGATQNVGKVAAQQSILVQGANLVKP